MSESEAKSGTHSPSETGIGHPIPGWWETTPASLRQEAPLVITFGISAAC